MLNLTQNLKLIQKLSPQQIQLIKLLEIPTMELEQRIKREIEENPVLEEGSADDDADAGKDQQKDACRLPQTVLNHAKLHIAIQKIEVSPKVQGLVATVTT